MMAMMTPPEDNIAFRTAPPEFATPFPGGISCQFWEGKDYLPQSAFCIDCEGLANADDVTEIKKRMREVFDKHGLVMLKNTGLTRDNIDRMRELAETCLGGQMDYTGGANPRGPVAKNVFEVGAPLAASLLWHHESAYLSTSTAALAFLGLDMRCANHKGATYLSDAAATTDAVLANPLGAKLRERKVCYIRNLTDREAFKNTQQIGVYNHWQTSFSTDSPEEAQKIAESRGLTVEWVDEGKNGRLMKTRFVIDAFEWSEELQRTVLFSSPADSPHWFDTWARVMHLPHNARPLDMTFGDGTPFTREEFEFFAQIHDKFSIRLEHEVGSVCVFSNWVYAHGRPGIHLDAGETRELGVMLGPKFDRQGGRWPQ